LTIIIHSDTELLLNNSVKSLHLSRNIGYLLIYFDIDSLYTLDHKINHFFQSFYEVQYNNFIEQIHSEMFAETFKEYERFNVNILMQFSG